MHLTPEQAVYSAAFTQALAAVCGLGRTRGDVDCTLPPPDPLPRGPLSPEAAAIYERLDEPHVVGSLPSTRGRPYPQRPPAQGRRRHGFQA